MKRALIALVTIAFAACSSRPAEQTPFIPAGMRSSSSSIHFLHGYTRKDGAPVSPFIALDGLLYGLSYVGGHTTSGFFYTLDETGKLTVLHTFPMYSVEGKPPVSGLPTSLVLLNNTFFATAAVRYKNGFVEAFLKIDRSGNTAEIRRFTHGLGLLRIAANGQIFGTSESSNGSVFSITPAGATRTLYKFRNGVGPNALLFLKGNLYGTTRNGGTDSTGTVFSLTLQGQKRTIYSFSGGSDGAYPVGSLVAWHGALYGTTQFGGNVQCPNDPAVTELNCGTVYTVTLAGTEHVLHNFNDRDGALPIGLTSIAGVLYGVTVGDQFAYTVGSSTIYSIGTDGQMRTLHHFGSGNRDGLWGNPGLTRLRGSLYGTTSGGADFANGVAFSYPVPTK